MVWNLFPFKGEFRLGRSQKSQGAKSGLERGWVIWVIWCFAKKLCMRRDAWAGTLLQWSSRHQLPTAAAFWVIQIVQTGECSSLTQNLMQIRCSTCSVILNVTATQYTCSLNSTYCPTDWYSAVVIVHTCAHYSPSSGCQATSMSQKPFLLY